MPAISKLTKCLLERSDINEFQLLQAEDYSLTRGISLEEALLFLEYVDLRKVGECLSIVHGLRYIPLLDTPSVEGPGKLVPLDMAQRHAVFPAHFDSRKNMLVLAVSDPSDPSLPAQLRKFLPEGLDLELCVASEAEIRQAIDAHYHGKEIPKTLRIDVPEGFSILPENEPEDDESPSLDPDQGMDIAIVVLERDRRRAGAIRSLLRAEGYDRVTWALGPKEAGEALKREGADLLVVNGAVFKPGGTWLRELSSVASPARISSYEIGPMLLGQQHTYSQMSSALIEMTSAMVRKSLGQNKPMLQSTILRIKHCKLMGLRLGLGKPQIDGLVLAGWLSSGGLEKGDILALSTPYRLEGILFPEEGEERIEASVLKLVMTYQMLIRKNAKAAADLFLLRKALTRAIGSLERERLVETYLKILKEEEFLGRVESGGRGHVLVIDPQIGPQAPLLLRLVNEGYTCETARTAKEAAERLSKGGVDLIISESDLGETDGTRLCLMLKQWPLLAAIPVVILTANGDQRLHADCLGAGADDFFLKPADLEVLSLKIRRLLARRNKGESPKGVRGSLKEMSTVDFLQSLSAGEKDVEIVLENGENRGRIYMREGAIVHAELSGLNGEEAFYALVPWDEGDFQILPCSSFPPQTIQIPLESLLIEGFRRVDEQQGLGEEGEEE
jgi:DNA-binding response OmpR family regulator